MADERSRVLTLVFTDLADLVGRFAALQAEAALQQGNRESNR